MAGAAAHALMEQPAEKSALLLRRGRRLQNPSAGCAAGGFQALRPRQRLRLGGLAGASFTSIGAGAASVLAQGQARLGRFPGARSGSGSITTLETAPLAVPP